MNAPKQALLNYCNLYKSGLHMTMQMCSARYENPKIKPFSSWGKEL